MRLALLLSVCLTCACAVLDGSGPGQQQSRLARPVEYDVPIMLEAGALRSTPQQLQRLHSSLDSLLLNKGSFLELAAPKKGEGADDENSNPIYLLPADPNYSPTGPNGFFPNNWFNPLTTSNTVGVLPPGPAAATGPSVGGTGGPEADGGSGGTAERAEAAAPQASAAPPLAAAFRAVTYSGGLLAPVGGPLRYNPLTFDAV